MSDKQGSQNGQSEQSGQSSWKMPTPGMKFHKMLIYFGLWLAIIINIYSGFSLITGRVYGEDADLVYEYFTKLKFVDMAYGGFYFLVAVLCVITWYFLKKLKEKGPKLLLVVQFANLIALWVYNVIVDVMIKDFDWSIFIYTAVYLVMIVCTFRYYDNRSYVFIH